MSINLVKELKKEKEVTISKTEKVVQEATLLLQQDVDKEEEALRKAGLNYQLDFSRTKKSYQMERESFEKKYKGEVFSFREIKSLCLKYNLRFLPANLFIGQLDNQVATKLKAFMDLREGEIGNYSPDFMIVAPENAFRLEGTQPKSPRKLDPILFYRIPGKDQYVFIWKWGKDFSFLRRLQGMYYLSQKSMINYTWCISFAILLGILKLSVPNFIVNPVTLFWLIPAVGLSFASVFIFFSIRYNAAHDDNWERLSSERLWNESTKRSF